ncbi:lauroyl acyltransferase [Amaricoccus sp.]|uniref:lysophospholipid acyltransferase family protein n=1 Tax=Amaricoccus sp. TaxID=1872485 RepID=UPI002D1FAD72|nr:lauroyl acyltransferase [Amaricoccus sp.]
MTLPARALIALARHLPYRLRLALGSALLRGAVALVPRLRSRVENNLRLIFPEMPAGERRRIRRAMADNFGRTFTEILSNPSFHGRGYWIAPEPGPGTEAILRAAREGSGAVLVTGHFGQWEAGRAWMKSSGIACAGVYRPLDEPELNAIYLENLEFGGTPIFPKSRRGVRGIVAHVARGGIVAILTDQFERRGATLDFIGHPAPTALVPAELAFRSKLPLVPIYGIRQPDGLHVRVVVEPPIPHSTVPEMMQAVNDSLAARVRAHPGQYYWLHRRWVKSFAPPR